MQLLLSKGRSKMKIPISITNIVEVLSVSPVASAFLSPLAAILPLET